MGSRYDLTTAPRHIKKSHNEQKALLANLLRKLRGNKSLRRFADDLNVSQTNLHNWEREISLPKERFLKQIAVYSEQSLDNLMLYIEYGELGRVRNNTFRTARDLVTEISILSEPEILELVKLMLDKYLTQESVAGAAHFAISKLADYTDLTFFEFGDVSMPERGDRR